MLLEDLSAGYEAQLSRLEREKAERAAAAHAAHTAKVRPELERRSRDFHNDYNNNRSAETEAQRRERLGNAMSDGMNAGNEYRDKHGGWEGLAKHLHAYVLKATNYGVDRITADDIAAQFKGVTTRTINKWLERPEFTRTARLLGRR
jgi:hypothetical protein